MAYKNVGKPTFLFCIFRCIVTLPYGGEHYMKNNFKGELAVMDSLDIKPNYVALGRKYGMDWRTVKKYHNGYEGRPDKRNKGSKLDEYRNEIKDKIYKDMEQMAKDWGLDDQRKIIHSKNSNEPYSSISLTAELPFDTANLFFNLIAKRYEKLSTVITTNSPFSKWSDIFQEPVLTNALLDRLLHYCSVININGPSYRLKDQMQYMIEEN